ncbi:MAG TPA: DUF2892 domain-containing protein [Halomonas sp.]|nr:DUF2892 domain-containing protein [Halomonas sp.]
MKRNVGNLDSGLRIIVGVALIALVLMSVIGWWRWVGVIPSREPQ